MLEYHFKSFIEFILIHCFFFKRVRFSTSVVFSLSVGLELLTPAFPQYFLLLASVANIAKQISLACYLATSVSFWCYLLLYSKKNINEMILYYMIRYELITGDINFLPLSYFPIYEVCYWVSENICRLCFWSNYLL